jgi:hypothetical protein
LREPKGRAYKRRTLFHSVAEARHGQKESQ